MRKIIAILILISASLSVAYSKDNSLISVKVLPLPENRVRIDFQFSKPLKQLPASFITQKPPRLVLDFISTDMQIPADQKTKTIQLGSLHSYNIVAVRDRIRAILELDRSVSYSGSTAGSVYSLVLNGKSNDLFENSKEVFITNQIVNAKHEIKRIDFRGIEKQGGRILIDVSDTGIPIDVTQVGKEIVVNFLNTRIPLNLMKRYDVSDFHSPVQIITMQQEGKKVRMTILSKGDYGHFVYQVNKQFMVDVFPLTAEEIRQAKLKKQVFTGKRISLNFQNISIRAVLQLLADFTGINMVVSDKVQGDITLRLNDIPWDQALDIILTTQGLDKRRKGNVMLIDTKASMDKMEEEQLKSQQTIEKLEPIRSDLIQINYAKAADIAVLIKDKQNSLLSDRGKISVDARTNTIWIQDTGTKIEEVRELIKQLDIPVKQVLIEARIVEVTKDFSQDIGIRWGVSRPTHLSGTLEGANELARGTAPANVVPLERRLNLDLAAAPLTGATPASVGIALAKLNDNILLDLELSALESEGRAELISSPRLITTNQQAAVIESGEEIPYQEATSSGATAVAFKKAVLSLKVTPQITPDGKILMDLQINQDTPSPQTFLGVPAIITKEIQTNVLVNNGQTIVLGGIYKQDKNKVINRIPFFGELPVVGILFSNRQITLKNEELLIFITPRIITNALSITTIEGREKDVYK
ncbi:type IV pilus secretin PilQ [Legionella pneumophila]|uniref:Type IV pilus assembly protein PilQ n=1 Tax=Legionella pneumophila subsp. pascullei TaxID=91890 RepID=A0AAX2IX32_LEGPN|nr:type IV pilus secretin PilQ [Legionella pneumophila]AMP90362.1 pilus assembly protein PilQ [Legionella pneumophila subsp. pascullei]AMP91970.1 pilus assembly protein PilQ [Legionella pneumophila subsp. pascullei]AMP94936.1 pilus assembly protein PilQ [Legionella pneumophila subsp. pascullei]SQG89793.1 type IV pilus assembly protein PilQ [Legionella pneumophila subsp. pascullei]VEH05419.1 type IV pilus assembly protein PilQ [Legionella pneumophila subsp. pascullei]